MKSWLVLLMATCVGTSVGLGITVYERSTHDELFLRSEFAARNKEIKRQLRESSDAWPEIEFVNGRVHDFGSMERYSKRRHTFLIKNAGDAPLSLEVSRTTCKCTISSVNGESFMPGETGEIAVEWTGQTTMMETDFRQGVEIRTNDPEMEEISLIITGIVTDSIRAFPPEVVVNRVSSNTGAQAEFRLFGYLSDTIEVLKTTFEKSDAAELFAVEYEPLPTEELEKEKGAKCGLLAKLSIKSGLPLGPINQTIRLETRVEKEATIYMTVKGQVVSDIVIASSAQFESRRSLLNFGPLKRNEPAKGILQIFVRGEHRHDTKLSVGEIDPLEYLKVDIGPPEELSKGKTIRYLVTIEIPPGLRRTNRLGAEYGKYGRVVLETTHPATKQVPVWVRFAVD